MKLEKENGGCMCYGWDLLSKVMLCFGVFVCALRGIGIGIGVPLIGFAVFRAKSKNISDRQQEEKVFMEFLKGAKMFFCNINRGNFNKEKSQKINIGKNKTYTIVICPRCFHRLRVPKDKGVIKICCPVCSEKFRERT